MFDAAIIGSGPAGFSAALTLKVHEKNVIWLGNPRLSEKIRLAEEIRNYPGLSHVTGQEMQTAFVKQAEAMGLTVTDHMVNSILPFGETYALMAGSEFYEAKTVILTTGVANVKTLPGEAGFVGRGISYCATCDGNLYRGKKIAVICNNPRFEHEVEYLAGLAAEVHYFPAFKETGVKAANVALHSEWEERPAAILSEEGRVTGLSLKDGSELAVDGVFCLRDAIAMTTLLSGLEMEGNHIRVDRKQATNLPGIFAAGDCTGMPYQYVKAAGEGNVAAHSVIAYLVEKEKEA